MRSIIEQVDEFIEGFFDGSIISALDMMMDLKKTKPLLARMSQDFVDKLDRLNDTLRREKIPAYLKATDPSTKAQLAEFIFLAVFELRYTGVIRNNPDTAKEITYWKNRCLTEELESASKDKVILDLKEQITKLAVGRSAIR